MIAALSSIRCVFLDRDGVINVKLPQGNYVMEPESLELCAGAGHAIAALNRKGLRVVVATNQRGIALGRFTEQQLGHVHHRLAELLAAHGAHLDAIYYCPHAQNACDCRKPLPGMLHKGFHDFPGLTAGNSIMVGDSLSDIQAGRALGMPTVFIEGNPETRDPGADEARARADYQAATLAEFVARYLE